MFLRTTHLFGGRRVAAVVDRVIFFPSGRCKAGNNSDPGHACLRDGWPIAYRGTVLCLLPKVASTSFKLALLKSAGVAGYPNAEGRFDHQPHGERLPDSVSGLDAAGWARLAASGPAYMIVRNPFTRLLSGFLDKVEGSDPAPRHWPSGFTGAGGFGAFVRAVVAEPAASLDKHFALQSAQCGLDAGMRYEVLRLEEEDAWYAALACRLQLQHAVASGWELPSDYHHGGARCFHEVGGCGCALECDATAGPTAASRSCGPTAPPHTATDRLLPQYYDAASVRLVADWARRDFELFGYSPHLALPPSHRGRHGKTGNRQNNRTKAIHTR